MGLIPPPQVQTPAWTTRHRPVSSGTLDCCQRCDGSSSLGRFDQFLRSHQGLQDRMAKIHATLCHGRSRFARNALTRRSLAT